MQQLHLLDVIEKESGVIIRGETSSVISSPFRRDRQPSFRIYYHPDEEEGLTSVNKEYSAQDWGTGKSYNALSFIHEIRGHDNWAQTFEYVRTDYGITINRSEQLFENKMPEMIKLISNSIEFTKETAPKIEKAILAFLYKNDKPMNELLSSGEILL